MCSPEAWRVPTADRSRRLSRMVASCDGRNVVVDGLEVRPVWTGTEFTVLDTSENEFRRGDADSNGSFFSIIDALFILEWGFGDGAAPLCLDAADVDDDGVLFPILDAIHALGFGFTSGPAPPAPGTIDCGADPTPDSIPCEVPTAGCE